MNPEAITGCILGTAVGDALGLPFEGLSPKRSAHLFKDKSRYHFLFSKGMVSDDTEHTCIVAQALIASADDHEQFARELSRRFRIWLLGLPAGIGFATLRSILKLWVGFPPTKSGVFSAGNGPAMRSAIIGVCYGDNDDKLKTLVRSATVISHTDPKAYYGALTVAVAAHMGATSPSVDGTLFHARLEHLLFDEGAGEFLALVNDAVQSAERGSTTEAFLQSQNLQNGISGYIYHTVPAVIHAWLNHPGDFRETLLDIISCGGDTDTTGAIIGAVMGSAIGKEGIPREWIDGLIEWPRTPAWMASLSHQLAEAVSTSRSARPIRLPALGVAFRNLVFTLIVLFHGFRRLFPPY